MFDIIVEVVTWRKDLKVKWKTSLFESVKRKAVKVNEMVMTCNKESKKMTGFTKAAIFSSQTSLTEVA